MHETPTILTEPAGILRIFMTSASRAHNRELKPLARLFQRRPLYRDIVHAARAAGFTCSTLTSHITASGEAVKSSRHLVKSLTRFCQSMSIFWATMSNCKHSVSPMKHC
ncbi:hypothetical protein [Acetobacter pasteurianus]|uniref:Uncharacterized protein n=1 Tax=Acetobacter pasteurianus NBRC 3188 TaxID=1226663 RepID=A0A401WYC3_ACEPA|nr:hypothetical protein [Acetobacter pasteurianus]GCD54331.1 hypothetical protein NBRC3188_3028 [Acetobacter pasteurianus NBRC 3188]